MIRKILKVKTKGSRETRDLRPAIIDDLPQGISCVVHEYKEVQGWCIVEIYGTDHVFFEPKLRADSSKINQVRGNPNVIGELPSHPSSPTVISSFSEPISKFDSVDEKTATKDKVKHTFKRKETRNGEEYLVLDEG